MNNLRSRHKIALISGISVAALFLGTSALAQSQIASDGQRSNELGKETVIVTGVSKKQLKKDATFSINTISAQDIKNLAPISTADLLQNLPGIYAEGSTAGEASNNITVRGLPVTGGFRYAPQLIDGLPWYEEPEVQFMNNDVAVRTDLMTKRVEVVKGGPGGILYSNGLGATVNYITRTGGQNVEGGYKFEATDYGLIRNDAYISGPINENLTFAIGGFYRSSDGIRDMGFTADHGGQIRGNLVYNTSDGKTKIALYGQAINDHTAFFQNVPFQVPRLSGPGTASDPTKIDAGTIQPIGIDFGHGTVVSPFNRNFTMLGDYGKRNVDISDGIHPNFKIFTLKFDHELDSGWAFSAGLRHTGGTNDFNGMFTGNDTAFAKDFNNNRYQNDLISAAHGAALGCDLSGNSPGSAKLLGFFNVPANACAAFANISRDNFINTYSNAKGVGAFYLDNGAKVADSTYLNFLLPFITNVKAQSTSVDLQAKKSFELAGTHNLTFGLYGSDYSNDQYFQSSLLVSTMENQSRLADLRALDANGNPFGPSLTLDGGILPGFFGYTSDMTVRGKAAYFLDHWETLEGRLKLDIGARWQNQEANVVRRDLNCCYNATPASIKVGSAADTTADNEIFVPGPRRVLNDKFDGFGWSIGGNYSFSKNLAVYGLASKSFRLPSLEDLNEFRVSSSNIGDQVETIHQYETGVRYYRGNFDTQIALFYNNFSPRQQVNTYRDFTSASCAVSGGVPNINACPLVYQTYQRGVRNYGTEIEASWRPERVKGLELKGNVVLQDPKIIGANYTIVNQKLNSGVVTGYEFVQVGEDGRRPRRLANVMVNVQGSYDLKPTTGLPIKPYFKYSYFGDRYSEASDFNVTLYPSYYHLDAGVIWDISDKMAVQLHVANITNQLSFTEGDPIFTDLLGPNGNTNRGVGRPLFGRTIRASLSYTF